MLKRTVCHTLARDLLEYCSNSASGPPLYVDNGNLDEFQPGSGCEGGSENIMGLVSGANIYIANTLANGAVNRQSDSHIVINAGLIAFPAS